ncbi:MAG: chromosomal replication initiator protein DnaA [Bacteroidales bacterium]|jgi:chromosomal replication initiator protein|nr:chromosomal replication initiator protein DnaA [Bacteroidales bacterium]NLM91328.1 chromosomal replication initiator protein DnaA [Bacteroidales bacterium]
MERVHEKVWSGCLSIIRDNISPNSFNTWFAPIKPVKLEKNILTIQVPSQFFYEWLEEHFIDLLKKTIKRELGPEGRLEYSIIMDTNYHASPANPYTVSAPTLNKKALKNPPVSMPIDLNKDQGKSIPNPFVIPGLKKLNIHPQLIDSYNFDNFIQGDCNRLARSAGLAVGQNPGKTSFNPLLIYSANGLGKTHLAHAIGIEVKNNFPEKTVLYVSSEQFTNQFVDSVRNNNQNDFIHFYQMIDVLIVDDIYCLAGKEKTQDVFFHIFNHLHQNGKQIVITSDLPPVEMKGIEPRLLSRFKWGLSADLQAPDYETRIAILQKKLYNDGVEMPQDVIELIASRITNNIREMEGALISILAQSSMNKKEITPELALKVIERFVKNTPKEITVEYIQKVVCDYFSIPVEKIHSKTRKREIVQARQIAMFFSKSYTKSSLAAIGSKCGNKDHATVLHACKTVKNLADTDRNFKKYVDEIENLIRIKL